jgi:hypothetical protein
VFVRSKRIQVQDLASPLHESVALGMMRMRPEYLASDRSDHSVGADLQVREAPDEEDDDENEQDKDYEENETDEEDDEDGYSV